MRSETSPHRDRDAVAQTTRGVIELLEVLWSQGRDMAPTAPVSSSQLRVLYVLERDRGINLRTLGEALGSAPSSVSRMCDRLHALGFIRRSPSPATRRELELRLSSHGETYLKDLRARRELGLLKIITSMPPEDQDALAKGLNSFRAAVEATGPKNGGRVAAAPWNPSDATPGTGPGRAGGGPSSAASGVSLRRRGPRLGDTGTHGGDVRDQANSAG
ncbi:MarR family winged helix-turn-helix transcriptional regulator [Streptomyces sp. NPDC058664]|uniref:MarR family winged helix-turn-helix transcriptional regulator n=1 Tax=unclassified Streptomyces TaxID=2593676 RepID=UPI003665423F